MNPKASEMISEFVLGNNLEMTIEEFIHTIHPHPTVSEIIKEAAHGNGTPNLIYDVFVLI